MREVTKSQIVPLSEQSCCWEEIVAECSEPERELTVSSHSLGFTFSPGLLLPVQLGQEFGYALRPAPTFTKKAENQHASEMQD